MSSLLKTEWLKIKKYPAFWWMLGIVALSYPGMNYAIYSNGYKDQLNDKTMGPILQMLPNPFTFPDAWQTVAFISSLFVFLPSIVVIMFITNEYAYKTNRQNIIDGWSRNDFMMSKLIDVVIITLLVTILYIITAFIIGSTNSGNANGNFWEGTKYIGLFFLQQFSQLSLALFIALLVRKAFITLGIFLFYYFPLEPILVQLAKKWANGIGEYLPLEISDRLIPFPRWFIRQESEWKALLDQSNIHIVYTLLLLGVTWGVCFWINKKRDL
ncbi:MAG: ABC transporter permease [Bacteroidota bacterium]|nr:ABC transporter permease [Flavisolibacter sp.]MBD0349592.1 ABC transporter permease [Flavisolibacter sp.]MBD0365802.1 ABC transporter permease [Flavisolibacter sp.]MDQ3846520.1 ABC transporter permease [Bacteroidota bacterium]